MTNLECIELSITKFNENILEHPFDVMVTDYIGLWGIRDADLFGFYKCRIRVIDSFGTDPSGKW